jgi:hypothetical protein
VPSPRKLVVVNLRAQPVEIQHGGEMIVVREFGHAELPALDGPQGQLAELEKQGAVAVQVPAAAVPPAKSKPASAGAKKKPPARRPSPQRKHQGGA